MLSPGDGSIDSQIVQDIPTGPVEPWRWVYQHPKVKLRVTKPAGLKYRIEFSIADATLKFTGPVTLRFLVNGTQLGRKRYSAAGEYRWEAPVPPELLRVSEENIIGAEVDKVWVSPSDGARLGFILSRIGLDR